MCEDGRRGVGGHRSSSEHNSVYNGQKRKYEKELTNTVSETVSTLRKLLVKLKDISESKTKAISDLERAVTKMRAQNVGKKSVIRGVQCHLFPQVKNQ
jgi:hypothetical protein